MSSRRRPRLSFATLAALSLAHAGCGAGAPSGGGTGATATPPVEPDSVVAPPPSMPTYALHEWGLLDADYGSPRAQALSGALPGVRPRGEVPSETERGVPQIHLGVSSVDKPVVYFHLDSGGDALSLRFEVAPAGGGRVLEHFPPGELRADAELLRYPQVRVTRGDCEGAYPAPSSDPCGSVDGVCEVRELARYETTDADCVHVGGTVGGFLFYRTGAADVTLPLRVAIESRTAVRVTQGAVTDPALPRVRGWIMRVYRPRTRASTQVRIASLDGTDSVVLERAGGDGTVGASEAIDALRAALVEAGLTAEEGDAFMRAWTVPLFGIPDVAGQQADADDFGADRAQSEGTIGLMGNESSRELGAVEDALLYILPVASVDALLPLTLDPPPRVSQRVFVARVNLHQTHPAHVGFGPVAVGGPAEANVVRRVLRRYLNELTACFGDQGLADTALLDLSVRPAGTVQTASASGPGLEPQVVACLETTARAMRFPATRGESTLQVTLRSFRQGF
ncbi:MAG: hypothetical protein KC593_17940 [Myxococcales bacterium]|nr:hypothetical protein [Myxococcales bacterium]MCB9629298.1 hypothetical protein [Sandaracinaceae bacterium]